MGVIEESVFIIPFRNAHPQRLRNLNVVLDWLKRFFPRVRTLLVEQDEMPNTPLQGYQHVERMFLQNGGPFNKSWAVNCAVLAAGARYAIVGDADMMMPPSEFQEAVGQLESHQAVSPFDSNRVRDLSDRETNELARTGRWETVGGANVRGKCPFAGGIVMFQHDAFVEMGGYPEEFEGWGGEDDIVSFKCERLLDSIERPWSAYHMWHDRTGVEDHEQFKKSNDRVIKIYAYPPDKFRAYCDEGRDSMGNPDKYY